MLIWNITRVKGSGSQVRIFGMALEPETCKYLDPKLLQSPQNKAILKAAQTNRDIFVGASLPTWYQSKQKEREDEMLRITNTTKEKQVLHAPGKSPLLLSPGEHSEHTNAEMMMAFAESGKGIKAEEVSDDGSTKVLEVKTKLEKVAPSPASPSSAEKAEEPLEVTEAGSSETKTVEKGAEDEVTVTQAGDAEDGDEDGDEDGEEVDSSSDTEEEKPKKKRRTAKKK